MMHRYFLSVVAGLICGTTLMFGQAYPDRHSTALSDGWLSCQTSANPNTARGNGHWIMYNLGDTYALTTSQIWNFNTPQRVNSYNNESWSLAPLQGKLEDGMRDVIIDISVNGTTWQEWGRFTIPKAPGSSFYQGVFGPDFGGKIARFILITGISNYGGSCYGLGEVKFNGTAVTISSNEDILGAASVAVSPNPFTHNTTLTLADFPAGEIQILISDIHGRQVSSVQIVVNDAQEQINIDGSQWPAGLYFARVLHDSGTRTIKMEIVR